MVRMGRSSGLAVLVMANMICGGTAFSGTHCADSSPPHRIALLELYTSEGCSSCPPADRWLSRVAAAAAPTRRLVALAFHVDYWDSLGWPDRFADARFSERQRQQAGVQRAAFVYTPQLIFNGSDYRLPVLAAGLDDMLSAVNRQTAGARIQLLQKPGASRLDVELETQVLAADAMDSSTTFLAMAESGLETQVRAGENRGRRLVHDFVVRQLIGPLAADKAGWVRWKGAFGAQPEPGAGGRSLAVFVQDARSGEVLQAIQAPMCGSR